MDSFSQLDNISVKKQEENDLKRILTGYENLINNRINEYLKRDKFIKTNKKDLFSRNKSQRLKNLNIKNNKLQNIFNLKIKNDINKQQRENTPKRKICFGKDESSQNKSICFFNTNNSSNQKTAHLKSILKNRTNLKFSINNSKIRNGSDITGLERNNKNLLSINLDSNKSLPKKNKKYRPKKNHSNYTEYYLFNSCYKNNNNSSTNGTKKIKYILANENSNFQSCINIPKINDSFYRGKNNNFDEHSKRSKKSDIHKNKKDGKNNDNSENKQNKSSKFSKNKSDKNGESKIKNFHSTISSMKKIKRKTFESFYKNIMYKKILDNQNLKILYDIDQNKVDKMIESQSTDNKMKMSLKEYQTNLLKNNSTFITRKNRNILIDSFKSLYDKNQSKHKRSDVIYDYINNIQKKEMNIINKNNKENENLLYKFRELGISPTKYNFKLDRIDFINVLINK